MTGSRLVVGVLAVLAGCQRAEWSGTAGVARQPLIYGADDRSEAAHSAALSSIVALIPRGAEEQDTTGHSFEAVHGLCPGERFAAQPAVAECTGVLITPRLIITAAHCLDIVSSCKDYSYVRNYYLEDGARPASSDEPSSVECDTTLLHVNTSFLDEQDLDFAVLELTAQVEDFVPPVLTRRLPALGEAVTTLGTNGGLPFKASPGHVLGVRVQQADYFDFSGDLYAGSSGSGVFDDTGALLGIHVRGSADFELSPEGCWRSRVVAEDGSQGSEQANTLSAIIDTLCNAQPQLELCEVPDHGDPTGSPAADASVAPSTPGTLPGWAIDETTPTWDTAAPQPAPTPPPPDVGNEAAAMPQAGDATHREMVDRSPRATGCSLLAGMDLQKSSGLSVLLALAAVARSCGQQSARARRDRRVSSGASPTMSWRRRS